MTILRIIHSLISVIEITLELFDFAVMQSNTQCLIYSIKKIGNKSLSCQNFKKYKGNSSEEKMKKKEPIDIDFTEQNADPLIMKMLLTLNNRMFKKKTRKILLWLTSLKITKAS